MRASEESMNAVITLALTAAVEKLRDAKEENIKIHATLDQTLSELNSF